MFVLIACNVLFTYYVAFFKKIIDFGYPSCKTKQNYVALNIICF